MRIFSSMVVALVLSLSAAAAEPWRPAKGPLATRWAKDVLPQKVHAEYPRPQLVRPRWQTLNGLWQLAVGKPDDAIPIGKDLPQQILVPFPAESALSGVMQRADRLWYRRSFEVPSDWRSGRVLLHFGAVDWESTVFVNGKRLTTHRGGYDAFWVDITEALTPSGPQELIVRVYDPTSHGNQPRGKQVDKPGGIYYTPSTGIWQSVWMEPVPAARIDSLLLTPDVAGSCLRVTVKTAAGGSAKVEATAFDGNAEAGRVTGDAGAELRLPIAKQSLKLWSPQSPHLYDLKVRLLDAGKPVDEVASYFGMRTIDLAKDPQGFMRLRLNGDFLFQVGPLDQGFWPDGLYTAPTDEALRYDIEITKKLGFNMTRKHVKVEPLRWYYWCDRLGLLVWQDMPSGNNGTPEARQQFQAELTRLVEGLRNSPAVIIWIVFNEGWGQHDTERYVDYVRKLDPSRLVSNASGWTDKQAGDVHDIHAYPGPAAPEPEARRAGVLGEFGGLGLAVPGHTWTQQHWGYRGTASSEELTRSYVRLLRGVWGLRESRGLSAAVYTQITDVETECNGLLSYDRAVVKVALDQVTAANQGRVPRLLVVEPTSQEKGIPWRYQLAAPPDGWQKPGFDDSLWKQGPGGFGAPKTPGAVVRTEWRSNEIWLRRTFELAKVPDGEICLSIHHDEDVEVYLNGRPAATAAGYTTAYEELPISAEARSSLKPGKNLIAIRCRQTTGGQYIDAGLVRLAPPADNAKP